MARLKYEDIKLEVESAGWRLISTSYTNLKTQMQFQCPNKHDNYLTMEYWRRHKECPICKANKYYQMNDTAPKKDRKAHRILAFDQAANTSGWSVFDDLTLVKFGKWTSSGSHSTEKIAQTKHWVANMIQTWKPDLVVFEDIQLQKFDGGEAVVTYKKLAQLQGVLKNYCYENGIIYKIVSPSTWRAFNNIRGKERNDKKKNAQILVKTLYDISVTQDEADAILIGRWAADDGQQNRMIEF